MQLLNNLPYDWELFSENIRLAHLKYSESFALLPSLSSKMIEELKIKPTFDPTALMKVFSQTIVNSIKPEKLVVYIQQLGTWSSLSNPIFMNYFNASHVKDKRFKDSEWLTHPFFSSIKDYYLQSSEVMKNFVEAIPVDNLKNKHKLSFYTKQLVDALAPVNFPFLNPEVIRETMNSYGQNLINGAENFLEDIKRGCETGKFLIPTTDLDGFSVGETLAITPGQVVFENELFQLIQYEPSTKEVFKSPILIIPAWINKYYILDLQPHNSLVKWIVDQGYTVFMISWINPDATFANKSFEDYMITGVLTAIEKAKEMSKAESLSCMGYCLGGTMLAVTLAYLAAQDKLHNYVNSATFLTTLVDFKEAGDIATFIDEQQLELLDSIMRNAGYLDGYYMALCFSILRSSDMIWSYYISNYLLGKKPQAFDILHWNSDSTRMPYSMHSYYLRKLYLENSLSKAGSIVINGIRIDLSKIDIPTYVLATKEDHIAPWQSVYLTSNIGKNCFVLGGSGHVVGIINPPNKSKYSYRINESRYLDPEEWFRTSKEIAGSWWPHWLNWASALNNEKIPLLQIDKKNIIEKAPGRYVKIK
ncbi:MAG: class I poly(R)-hydroxyalkanoic acid synthase [Candidatus Midichloria sp.]|nr:class I poly(R)-hydroxyalkanoic acid synthase [Candidatus Midichloria sp.]